MTAWQDIPLASFRGLTGEDPASLDSILTFDTEAGPVRLRVQGADLARMAAMVCDPHTAWLGQPRRTLAQRLAAPEPDPAHIPELNTPDWDRQIGLS